MCALWVHSQPPPRPGGRKGLGSPKACSAQATDGGVAFLPLPPAAGSAWAKLGSRCLTPSGPASGKRTA